VVSTEAEIFSYFLSPLALWERGRGEGKYRQISASVLMAWESIVEEWHGNVTTEAITEAVQLANRALFDHLDKYVLGYEMA